MNWPTSGASILTTWYSKRHNESESPVRLPRKMCTPHIYAKGINPFKMSKEFPLIIPLSSAAAFSSPYHYLYPCVYVNALFAASSYSFCSSSSLLPIFSLCVMWLCKWLSRPLFHTYSHTHWHSNKCTYVYSLLKSSALNVLSTTTIEYLFNECWM